MRKVTLGMALVLPVTAVAEDWVSLTGEELREALTGRTLTYANGWQDFNVTGRTLYNAGTDSWGHWRVQGDQYCSQWPPSDLWTCYTVERQGDRLRFVGQGGDTTDATYGD